MIRAFEGRSSTFYVDEDACEVFTAADRAELQTQVAENAKVCQLVMFVSELVRMVRVSGASDLLGISALDDESP